jgi:hypothetical protein
MHLDHLDKLEPWMFLVAAAVLGAIYLLRPSK